MGELVEGKWIKGWYTPDKRGAFERPKTVFRNTIAPEDVELDRYHLYVSYACPWAHRTLIVRALRRLEHAIEMTALDPHMSDEGWSFGGDGEEDPLFHSRYLRDIYLRADPHYTGRVTVPVLWDKKKNVIVNNESRDVMRIIDTAFDKFAEGPCLAPAELRPQIDARLDEIYNTYNNGVYRAGFAGSQECYDEAVRDVFGMLDKMEQVLASQRWLCGDTFTEADVAFFTTSLRFDLVYYSHFKCNVRRIRDYPNIWRFVRDVYSMDPVKRVCRLDEIKIHYYWSQTTVNPSRIVPVGPSLDLE
jgi:putative glutathione S-transferase